MGGKLLLEATVTVFTPVSVVAPVAPDIHDTKNRIRGMVVRIMEEDIENSKVALTVSELSLWPKAVVHDLFRGS
jgi:hypothetical protein